MSSRQVKAAREAFLSGQATPEGVRSEILTSWRRCELSGVNADRLALPFSPDFDPRLSKLYLAAEPVLARFADRLLDTHSSIVLADRRARVLGRWSGDRGLDNGLERLSVACGFSVAEEVAGTNGLGTALEEGRPAAIQGSEHFAEQFMTFTCVGSPIRHPITHHIEGGINIACRFKDSNSLVLPMVLEMASEIEQALYLQSSERERALFDSFLEEARKSILPVVSMSEQLMMANAAAARLLDGTDQVVLWEQAHQAVAERSERSIVVTLADGRAVAARCKPVDVGGRSIGVVIELDSTALAAVRTRRRTAAEAGPASSLVGESRTWIDLEALVRTVARTRLPILFVGEPGTGKCSLARYAHQLSEVGGEFAIHDAALVKVDGSDVWLRGLRQRLERHEGTVLLRHLALLDGATAGGVCGLLDAVAGQTPRLMASAMTEGSPESQALFDRLGVVRVSVPPLRQRPEDIKALATDLVSRHSVRRPAPRLGPEAVQALLRLDWPGNVRQLENVIKGLVSTGRGSDIQLDDLPEDVRRQTSRRRLSRLEQVELDQILLALRQCGGNKLEAAKALGISRATLYRKLAAFGVELDRSIF
jgi:sigma-54 dependent transcriptional regulator, acetoin dehydrogenase operon transcriptional activator AcoR